MNSRHRSIPLLLLLPGALSLCYLAASLLRLLDENTAATLETLPFPLITVFLTAGSMAYNKKYSHSIKSRGHWAYSIPGFMAPTALFSAWTLAPSHLGGVAWGGIHYFLEAITRYPDLGPVNSVVLLGIATVLCASLLPAIISWGYQSAWSKHWMYPLTLLAITAYLTVTVNLDFNLWLAGLYGSEQESLLFLLYGPLSRSLAIMSTIYLSIRLALESKQGSDQKDLNN